jgi:hypothetical protein
LGSFKSSSPVCGVNLYAPKFDVLEAQIKEKVDKQLRFRAFCP